MSPSIAEAGRLATDPEVGSAEWTLLRRQHDEAVARAAKLRQLQSRLPLEIHDAELQVRSLAGRLGLDLFVKGRGRRRPDGLTDVDRETLAVLPARVREVAARLGVETTVATSRLHVLRAKGAATKDPGYGAVWRPVPVEVPA